MILVYRENNKLKKKMVNAVHVLLTCTNRVIGLNVSFLPSPPPADQTNARMALSHGDADPVRFRWLIPFSALQVRLGNAAGKSLTPAPSSPHPSVCFILYLTHTHTPPCSSVFVRTFTGIMYYPAPDPNLDPNQVSDVVGTSQNVLTLLV